MLGITGFTWVQAAFPNPDVPVIKLMLTPQFDSCLFLFYSVSYLEEKKTLFIDLFKPQHRPTFYMGGNWTHSVCKWQSRGSTRVDTQHSSQAPCSISVPPRCLFRLKLYWQKEKKYAGHITWLQLQWVTNYLSQLLMSCLLPGHEFRKHFLVYSHEECSKMVSSSSLLGKNWMLTQQTLFLFPKIPLLLIMPIFLMGKRERVQFLYRTVQALSQGRLILVES